jgi:hypothetical protein
MGINLSADTPIIKVSEYSITNDIFKNHIHIDLDFSKDDIDLKITNYIQEWYNTSDVKDLIINKNNEFIHFLNGYPKMVYNNDNIIILSSFTFKSYKDISRVYKIKKILND